MSKTDELKAILQPFEKHIRVSKNRNKQGKSLYLAANDVNWVSNDYRGKNISEALTLLGMSHIFLDHHTYLQSEEAQKDTRSLILFRTDTHKSEYLKLDEDSKIVYDTDDLCFDRRYFTHANVPGIRATTKKNQEWLLGGSLDGQEDIIKNSLVGTGPTNRIVQSMTEIGSKHGLILDNVLPNWMSQQALEHRDLSVKTSHQIRILYASGTNTHQEDFMVAWPGINQFLRKNASATLTFLGYLPLNKSELRNVSGQIRIFERIPHKELLPFHANFDMAIAPLAINEFTEAKSALKFVHAAALGIPCLATPSSPFLRSCSKKFPHLLVEEGSWFESLENLTLNISQGLREQLVEEFEENWTLKTLTNQVSQLIDVAVL